MMASTHLAILDGLLEPDKFSVVVNERCDAEISVWRDGHTEKLEQSVAEVFAGGTPPRQHGKPPVPLFLNECVVQNGSVV